MTSYTAKLLPLNRVALTFALTISRLKLISAAIAIFAITFLSRQASAAGNEWTWMHGPDGSYERACYGEKRVPASENTPGQRNAAASWTDSEGNLWLFGGSGISAPPGAQGYLNDLWKYEKTSGQWAWMSGSNGVGQAGTYGVQGTPDSNNVPGARHSCLSWTDSSGRLWLFGGESTNGYMNDLWVYDPTSNLWTWMDGGSGVNIFGVYGTKGTEHPDNVPGGRANAVSWKGTTDTLWLYGGQGRASNDLWKYDLGSGNWTWVHGSSEPFQPREYGNKGEAAPENNPGSRGEAASCVDENGNFWLFGGGGSLNDLWKFDVLTSQWTWVAGSASANQVGIYGTQGNPGPTNSPGGRGKALLVSDNAGNLLLFGGDGFGESSSAGMLNDLWRFNISSGEWTWVKGSKLTGQLGVYGVQGNSAAANIPGARRQSMGWTDGIGKLWMFGGHGIASDGLINLNDLWEFDLASTNWTWIKGSRTIDKFGVYGTLGIAAITNIPGVRERSVSWTDSTGNLWLFGGYGHASVPFNSVTMVGFLNDLWMYERSTGCWTWKSGSKLMNQVGSGPGAREGAASWIDETGKVWLFGGVGYATILPPTELNDMWSYDPDTNSWTSIRTYNEAFTKGNYGLKGQTVSENWPSSRKNAMTWTDTSGNFWLFGGRGEASIGDGELNDLWKYDRTTGFWTWMKGSNLPNEGAVTGEKGIEALENNPKSDEACASWTDSEGHLWMMSTTNHLWKFNISSGNWAWIEGGTLNSSPVYGMLGVPAAGNTPGGRNYSAAWTDASSNLWQFGGAGKATTSTGLLNDLWKFNPVAGHWAWIRGESFPFENGRYGTIGLPASGTTPGGRRPNVQWTDPDGNFWMFGSGTINDLWKFTPANLSGIRYNDAMLY